MLQALLRALAPYGPVVAGTFPLGVFTADSDLDILCEVDDFTRFAADVRAAFGDRESFTLERADGLDPPAMVARFVADGTIVEIFGQAQSVYEQNGFRHLLVEARLLRLGGDELREQVRALKRQGLGTEPAFARLIGLGGDAYEALLRLEDESDESLRERLPRAGGRES